MFVENRILQVILDLRNGLPVCFPTDTVYAIATDPFSNEGIEKIYQLKGRQRTKPLALLINQVDQIDDMAYMRTIVEDIDKFMPGKITFLLPCKKKYEHLSNEQKIGIRLTQGSTARSILRAFGAPLAATSVNLTGEKAKIAFEDIDAIFHQNCTIIKDEHLECGNEASSVLDLFHWPKVSLIRNGAAVPNILQVILDKMGAHGY